MGTEDIRWFVMRDLSRYNAKTPCYKMLSESGYDVFTPMKWQLEVVNGRKVRVRRPVIPNLLFVRDVESRLEAVTLKYQKLQFIYVRGGRYREPMVVRDSEMDCFMRFAALTDSPEYFSPQEITPEMCGRRVRIVDGPLNGCECRLLTVRGSKVKRLMVELPGLIAVAVEVSPRYIQFIK